MQQRHSPRPLLISFTATMLFVALAAFGWGVPASASPSGPSLTVKGANHESRDGPDDAVLHECPLTVMYANGTPGGTVSVDVVTVDPTTPAGASVLSGAHSVTLNASGQATVLTGPDGLDFSGITPYPHDSDLFKVQVRVQDGGTLTTTTFWVADCEPAAVPATTTTTSTTSTTAVPTSTTGLAIVNTTTTTVASAVLGETVTRTPGSTAVTLPVTGDNAVVIVFGAMFLVIIGSVIALFARLGRSHH